MTKLRPNNLIMIIDFQHRPLSLLPQRLSKKSYERAGCIFAKLFQVQPHLAEARGKFSCFVIQMFPSPFLKNGTSSEQQKKFKFEASLAAVRASDGGGRLERPAAASFEDS